MSNSLLVNKIVSYWKTPANRRKFFIEFAKKKRFDPLLPENWYNIKQKDILEKVKRIRSQSEILMFKQGRSVLYYYANYRQAIAESFPEISTLSFLLSQLLFSPRYCRFFASYKSNRPFSAQKIDFPTLFVFFSLSYFANIGIDISAFKSRSKIKDSPHQVRLILYTMSSIFLQLLFKQRYQVI